MTIKLRKELSDNGRMSIIFEDSDGRGDLDRLVGEIAKNELAKRENQKRGEDA